MLLVVAATQGAANADCLSPINNMTTSPPSTIPFAIALSNPPSGGQPGWVGFGKSTLSRSNATTAQSTLNFSQLFSDRLSGTQPFNIGSVELIDFTVTSGGALSATNHTSSFSWTVSLTCVTASVATGVSSNGMVVVLNMGSRVN
jgi:hypothetical protein